jgi:hypothetical protein
MSALMMTTAALFGLAANANAHFLWLDPGTPNSEPLTAVFQ